MNFIDGIERVVVAVMDAVLALYDEPRPSGDVLILDVAERLEELAAQRRAS